MGKRAKKNDNGDETKKDCLKWTERMDSILLDALLEQQELGNRPDGTFTTGAYNNVVRICTDKLGFQLEKDHIKNRIKTIKNNFTTCFDIFRFDKLSGFAWSSETKKFEAEPEVWNNLLKENPNAKKWRHTEIAHYDKLYELFSKDRANGEGATSAKEKVSQWAREESSHLVDSADSLDDIETFEPTSPMSGPSPSNSQGTTSTKSSKRKAPMADILEKQIEVIKFGMTSVAEAIREGNAIAEKGFLVAEKGIAIQEKGIEIQERSRPRYYSEDEVFAELLRIEVPEHLQISSFMFLIKNQQRMRAFFGVPPFLRT